MGIFGFMAEQRIDEIFGAIPFPQAPQWLVSGGKATLEWDETVALLQIPSKILPGMCSIEIVDPPPIEDVIELLYKNGWRRGGLHENGAWRLYAYICADGVEIRIHGAAGHDHPDKNEMLHFYAPEPPPITRRKTFKAEYEEYMRKCREDEW